MQEVLKLFLITKKEYPSLTKLEFKLWLNQDRDIIECRPNSDNMMDKFIRTTKLYILLGIPG